MKVGRAAGVVGGVVIIGGLLVALLYGLRVPAVQAFIDPAGESVAMLWDALRGLDYSVPITPAAANGWAAVAIAAVAFTATTILVPVARQGRGLVLSALLWATVGLLLYSPGLVR